MTDRPGEGGRTHDENAGADGGFQLITQHGGEYKQHHHAAASAHKATDETDHSAAEDRTNRFLSGGGGLKPLLWRQYRLDDKLDAEKESHQGRKAAHSSFGDNAGDVAAHQSETQDADHHDNAVFDIEVFIFAIGIGGSSAGQDITGKSNANGKVGIHM